jgi:hypothetical protein
MMFDQATAVTRLNITDPGMVALAGTTIDTALAVAEAYCDRKFTLADDIEVFVHPFAHALLLHRYPVEDVQSISGFSHSDNYHVDKPGGRIIIDGVTNDHVVTVTYKGGYDPLPPDLELALWMVFDNIWPMVSGTGSTTGDRISSVTVPDVGTIRYDTGGAASTGGAQVGGLVPMSAAGILSLYRRHVC